MFAKRTNAFTSISIAHIYRMLARFPAVYMVGPVMVVCLSVYSPPPHDHRDTQKKTFLHISNLWKFLNFKTRDYQEDYTIQRAYAALKLGAQVGEAMWGVIGRGSKGKIELTTQHYVHECEHISVLLLLLLLLFSSVFTMKEKYIRLFKW